MRGRLCAKNLLKMLSFCKFPFVTMQAYGLPPLRPLHLLIDGGGKDSSEGQRRSWTQLLSVLATLPSSTAKTHSWKRSVTAGASK
jgi:hypothetical protein